MQAPVTDCADGDAVVDATVSSERLLSSGSQPLCFLSPALVMPGHMTLAPPKTYLIAPVSTCILGIIVGTAAWAAADSTRSEMMCMHRSGCDSPQ
jgi:hypothetical protein